MMGLFNREKTVLFNGATTVHGLKLQNCCCYTFIHVQNTVK